MARTTFCRVGGGDEAEAESAIVVFIQLLYNYNYLHVNRKPARRRSTRCGSHSSFAPRGIDRYAGNKIEPKHNQFWSYVGIVGTAGGAN
jgi:hypothetical protein